MLILNSSDIERCIQPNEVIDALEEAILLYETSNFVMPDRTHINFQENTLLMMPAFSEEIFGTKLVSIFPENKKQNLPPIFGSMMLNDANNGKPLTLINGSSLTAHRTGALGGLTAKNLVTSNSNSVGIIGAGVQSLHQAFYIINTIDVKEIYIFDLSQHQINNWKESLKRLSFKGDIIQSKTAEDLVLKCDIVVTTTTSENPVFNLLEDDLMGKKILGFGSYKPSMREFPDTLFLTKPKIFIDTKHAMEESGDLAYPLSNELIDKENIFTLGKLINKQVRLADEDTIIFKSVGMALFDLIVSKYLYKKAIENNIGNKVIF